MTQTRSPQTRPSGTARQAVTRPALAISPALAEPVAETRPARTAPLSSRQVFEYRFRPLSWRDALGFALAAAGVIVLAGCGLWLYYSDYTQHGIAAAYTRSQPWLSAALVVGLLAVLMVFLRLRSAVYRVTQSRQGLVLTRLFLPAQRLNWEDIAGIASGVIADTLFGWVIHTRIQTTLYLTNGRRLPLDSRLPQLAELTTRLKASLYRRIYPRLRTDFLDGYSLDFGPLTLQRTFIALRGHKFPWAQVKHVTIQAGWLVVELKQGKTMRLCAVQIPNLELIFRLISEGVRP